MNKIFKLMLTAVVALGFVACETYEVGDPDMTAVSDFDGQWVCFAYEAGQSTPSTVFDLLITNTTNNDADRFWLTVADCCPYFGYYYLDALRFEVQCDGKTLSFGCTNVDAEQPNTCHNVYLEQSYYTAGRAGAVAKTGYKVTVTGGKVTLNGVDTASGYKADAIEFDYTRVDPDGTTTTYKVKGMKNTGWAADMKAYGDFMDENF